MLLKVKKNTFIIKKLFFCSFSFFKNLSIIRCYDFYPLAMKSFEYSSPSELDKGFFEEQSLLSTSSLEQPSSTSNPSEANGSDVKPSIQASPCLSLDPISPPKALSTSSFNIQETDNCYLTMPLQGKFSTPLVLPQKSACLDQLYNDLTAAQMCWDVSFIKSETNSPKPNMESSALEQMWSPKPQSTQQPLTDVSP